jgi:PPK2 family polyphosphate:nucleotide phosphotransferase
LEGWALTSRPLRSSSLAWLGAGVFAIKPGRARLLAMTKFAETFQVKPGSSVSLANIDPRDTCGFKDKEETKLKTAADAEAINELQDRLYAEGRRSLLVILQGMDASGKDGTLRGVFNACGPLGVHATSFKVPSEVERSHDYLWRVHAACPASGMIGVFNRSHYEDVLVVKVKGLVPEEALARRYGEINGFEKMLSQNGTEILKFMLHISPAEQKQRLQERLDDPAKQWKFNPGDLDDRKLWPEFMAAYEKALSECSTQHAPWHIVPADRKWVRNAIIARIVREKLEEMDPQPAVQKSFDPTEIVIPDM